MHSLIQGSSIAVIMRFLYAFWSIYFFALLSNRGVTSSVPSSWRGQVDNLCSCSQEVSGPILAGAIELFNFHQGFCDTDLKFEFMWPVTKLYEMMQNDQTSIELVHDQIQID